MRWLLDSDLYNLQCSDGDCSLSELGLEAAKTEFMLSVHCGCCTSGFSLLLKLLRKGQILCFLSSVEKNWCTVHTMLCDNIEFKWFWWETSVLPPTPAPLTDDTPVKEIFPCKIFRPWTWTCVAAWRCPGRADSRSNTRYPQMKRFVEW